MLKRYLSTCTFFFISILTFQAQEIKSYSSTEIFQELEKLQSPINVLYIAAHPDDENTRLMSYLVNKKNIRTAYLSLTRGDGGQNLIGAEQGIELGLIRRQELLMARKVDGAEQYFTRALDFGYSKSPEETLAKWNKDSILFDMVWVIRKFRPEIIITRFSSDGSGGHGHHTTSAILAEIAYDMAGDSTAFPEQLKFLAPWKPLRLLHNSTLFFRDPNADVSNLIPLNVGDYIPMKGMSCGEIAADSRSMHKSQGFGVSKQRGDKMEYFQPLKGDTAHLKSIFDGFENYNEKQKFLALDSVSYLLDYIVKIYDLKNPTLILPHLLYLYQYIAQKSTAQEYPFYKKKIEAIILSVCGIHFELISNEEYLTQNSKAVFQLNAILRSEEKVEINKIAFRNHLDETNTTSDTVLDLKLIPNNLVTIPINTSLEREKVSQPLWLENMPTSIYSISFDSKYYQQEVDDLGVIISLKINDYSLEIPVKLIYSKVDPTKGEVHNPVVICPPVLLYPESNLLVGTQGQGKKLKVKVTAMQDNLKAILYLSTAQENWKISNKKIDVQINTKGESQTIEFDIASPKEFGKFEFNIIAEVDNKSYSYSMRTIDYDHIEKQTWFPQSKIEFLHLDIQRVKNKIGYIPGAGDEVAHCLSLIGYTVTTLDNEQLDKSNLQQYETIVMGVRAFNTNPFLLTIKEKFLNYVKNGGNLIVQYNTNNWNSKLTDTLGPYPFEISRTRVTDENSFFEFSLPQHTVFNTPNKIGKEDFNNWIQERGIYFATNIDSHYETPLVLKDFDEEKTNGSLIIGKYKKGYFIYTGLAFFRELPAGVPGAYRFFTNLIELK